MRTKKVLETIDVMTESVVKELNDINEKIDNKANHSYVQTIAKHVMNLESRLDELEKVAKLENCVYAQPESEIEKNIQQQINMINAVLREKKAIKNKEMIIDCEDAAYITVKYDYDNNERTEILLDKKRNVIRETKTAIYTIANPQTDYFLKAKNLLIEYAEKTMIKKGMEYTPVGDRFANFRPILGEKKTAIEKLIGYNAKHVQYCFTQESNMTAKTINELLEHWGDVFNYNVLGLAMQNTDKEPYYIVPYADREAQEKEIKNIVDSVKNNHLCNLENRNTPNDRYLLLLTMITQSNLFTCIYLFAKQLERLEGK